MPIDRRLPNPNSYPKNWFEMAPSEALDYAASVVQEVGLGEPFRIAVVGDHFPIFGVAVWWGEGECDCHGANVKPLTKANIRKSIIEVRDVRRQVQAEDGVSV